MFYVLFGNQNKFSGVNLGPLQHLKWNVLKQQVTVGSL